MLNQYISFYNKDYCELRVIAVFVCGGARIVSDQEQRRAPRVDVFSRDARGVAAATYVQAVEELLQPRAALGLAPVWHTPYKVKHSEGDRSRAPYGVICVECWRRRSGVAGTLGEALVVNTFR